MRVSRKRLRITHSVVAGTSLEDIAESQRAKRGVPTSTSSANGQALLVHIPAFYKIFCTTHAVIHIDDTPIAFQTLAIHATIACAATIVNIQHSEATTRPIGNTQIVDRMSFGSWPSMTHHNKRRQFVR